MSNSIIYLNIVIPVLIKIIIPDGRFGSFTIITDLFVIPLLLLMLNIFVLMNKLSQSVWKLGSLMLCGLMLGVIVSYLIWGISSKRLLNPDAETLLVYKMLFVYYSFFSLILIPILKLIQTIRK